MKPEEMVTAVLKHQGWKYGQPHFSHDGEWHIDFAKEPFEFDSEWAGKPHPLEQCIIDDQNVPDLLHSLDACHEVFEKDAPDGYWKYIYEEMLHTITISPALVSDSNSSFLVNINMMSSAWMAVAKATCSQRCEAWLRFNGLWKD
jgi:hypothetical protein